MAAPDESRKRTWRFRLNDATTLEVSSPTPATEKQVRRRGRWSLILGTLIAAVAVAAVAYADNVQNDVAMVGGVKLVTITAGDLTGAIVNYNIAANSGDGQTGCNASDGSAATVTPQGMPSGVSTTPSSLSFTLCKAGSVENAQGVTFKAASSTTPGDYPITASVSDSGVGTYNTSPAAFTLRVLAPPPPSDTTSPTVTVTAPSAPAGQGGWFNAADLAGAGGSLTVNVSATDASGVTNISCTKTVNAVTGAAFNASNQSGAGTLADPRIGTVSVSDQGTTVVTCVATDGAIPANTGAANAPNNEDTVMIDATAPNAPTASVNPTPNAAGWNNSVPVTVSYASNGDAGSAAAQSGVAGCTADQVFNAETSAAGTPTNGTCTDVAGNTSTATSVTVKIDLTDPSVEITSPADGLNTIASSINVSGTATDTPSGIAAVTVNGSAATLGTGTFTKSNVALACGANVVTAIATDVAGRTDSDTITVNRLCFTLQYLQPIDQSSGASSYVVNKGKYGRVIPVKVIVYLNGVAQTDADLAGYGLTLQIGVNGVSCSGGSATDVVEAYADAGSANGNTNMFRWLFATNNSWGYNLDTGNPPGVAMTIGSCYRLDVYVDDGTNHVKISNSPYAIFQPTK